MVLKKSGLDHMKGRLSSFIHHTNKPLIGKTFFNWNISNMLRVNAAFNFSFPQHIFMELFIINVYFEVL